MSRLRRLLMTGVFGGGLPWYSHTLSLQPDGAAGADTIVLSDQATTNFSTNASLYVGELKSSTSIRRTLIKFDLSSIPDNARIISATLSLFCNGDESDTPRAFKVYRLKRNWVLSQVTWNIFSTGNNWQTAGGFGENDCDQVAIASRNFTDTESLNQFKDFALVGDTKAALDLGYGWLIKADTEDADAYGFASSNNATATIRPTLVIDYESNNP